MDLQALIKPAEVLGSYPSAVPCKLFEHSLLLGWPVVMKSSSKWSRLVTPHSIAIHWSPSAMALKTLGADLSPNGSTVSI